MAAAPQRTATILLSFHGGGPSSDGGGLIGVPRDCPATIEPRSAELADLRAWAGLSQQELADQAGLVRAIYALLERTELPLRPDVAQALSRVLGRQVREVELAYGRTARRRRVEAGVSSS